MLSQLLESSPRRSRRRHSTILSIVGRRSRFTPAELRGRKVPQLVSQPFVFLLRD